MGTIPTAPDDRGVPPQSPHLLRVAADPSKAEIPSGGTGEPRRSPSNTPKPNTNGVVRPPTPDNGIPQTNGYNTSPARLNDPAFRFGSERGIPTAPFDAINDSGELYKLTQYYMMIKEPMENENLIRAINRVK